MEVLAQYLMRVTATLAFLAYTLLPTLCFLRMSTKAAARGLGTKSSLAALFALLFLFPHFEALHFFTLSERDPVMGAADVESQFAFFMVFPLLALLAWPVVLLLARFLPKKERFARPVLYKPTLGLAALWFIAGTVMTLNGVQWRMVFLEYSSDSARLEEMFDNCIPEKCGETAAMIAMNAKASPQLLTKLADYDFGGPGIQMLVAQNPGAPRPLLERFAAHSDANIQVSFARNPNAPRDLLEAMAKSDNETVRLSAQWALKEAK